MNVTVNGTPQEHPAPLTVEGLLQALDLAGRPVVVELNQQALFPREHATTPLQDGDVLEVVQITAGG